jgi:hypothetical protein
MYKVVGQDQREYGPVSRENILEWIAQGRANGETIAKFEDGAWKPLRTFEEFKEAFGVPPPVIGATTVVSSGPEPSAFSGVGSQRNTNVPSVIGLVAPIVCCCCGIGPIVGIIFSLIGLSQIKANPGKYSTSDVLPKIGLGISIFLLVMHGLLWLLDAGLSKYLSEYLEKMPKAF